MLVKLIMKVLSNLLGNNSKINISEIAYKDKNNNPRTLDNKMITVYENSTGSNNGVTLSQNVDNAKYFLVTYRQEGYTGATKTDVVMTGESNHQLSFSHRNDTVLYTFLTYISISGTSLSVVSSTGLAVGANTAYGVSGTTIYVTKVVAIY